MDFSDDEMLFDPALSHSIAESRIADNNDQQSQEGSIPRTKVGKRRSRTSKQSSFAASSNLRNRSDSKNKLSTSVNTENAITTPYGDQEILLPQEKRDRQWLIDRIELVFEQQVDGLLAGKEDLTVTVQLRPRDPTKQQAPAVRQFKFPGKSEKDAWRYTVIIRILELIHGALIDDNVITKRDIYYRDPKLFSKQDVVDRFVDDLAYTFGVPRMLMNVTATAKGLIAGNFKINRTDGSITDGTAEREGMLITPLKDDEVINIDRVKWVLVVEKEATFRSLVSSSFSASLFSHYLLVTGKGFPDIATRHVLRSIAIPSAKNNFMSPPVHCLVDFDPDGLDILSTYKHGSAALAHEKRELELPMVQWLGIKSQDIGRGGDLHEKQGLLSLTARDRRKAIRMLERSVFEIESEWRQEVQRMLMLNIKCEIQVLEAREGGTMKWLEEKDIS